MLSSKKIVHFKVSNFFSLFVGALLLIGAFWLFFIGLTYMGFPFPSLSASKFLDLGLFSLSTFGLIVFLTMVPFQTVEGKLSPIFYARIFNAPSAHFGIYVLMWSFIICFAAATLQQVLDSDIYSSQLFISLVTAIAFAILFHRSWVLRCLHQPYVVDTYIKTLKGDESNEEIWTELFECTLKAMKDGRVIDARNFVDLMSQVYDKCSEKKAVVLKEDLLGLHAMAHDTRPVARYIEEKWPFCAKRK